jgi:glucose/arabinose dehydrogenase
LLAAGAVASVACSQSKDNPAGTAGTSNTSAGGTGNTAGGTGGSTSTTGGSSSTTGGTGNAGASTTGGAPNGGASNGGSTNGGTSGGGGTGPVTCDASAAPAISKLGVQTVVQSNDFRVMVYAAQAPGSDDWYLVDALGFVRVYSGGTLQPTPFLDLSSEVQGSDFGDSAPAGGSQDYDERGLLSIAFPPDYATSGKFYVTIVPTSGSSIDHDLVLEFTRSAGNPLVADPASRKVIFELEEGGVGYMATGFSYAKYHNGSTLKFGPDGMLYFAFGDGGGDCNAARPGTPQDVSSPYGKILRLDPSQPAPYAAADNPFPDGDKRVFHYGVRNPFRFSFDSATGDLYIGEVGQWSHDSIAFAPAGSKGLNFGWPSFEGTAQNPTTQCQSNTQLRSGSTRTSPIFNLAHGSSGGVSNLIVAIVGGSVYRGSAIPTLSGAYLFGEFYPNRPMRALYQCGTTTSEVAVIQKRCDPNTPNAACFAPVGGAPELSQVAAIVEGHDKELYIPANGNTLLKIVPAP